MYVVGCVVYVDDMLELLGLLYLVFGLVLDGYVWLDVIDLEVVCVLLGVVGVYIGVDIFGINDVSLVFGDDKFFVDGEILYLG